MVSDADRKSRARRFYVTDMIGFANNALSYTAGLSRAEFLTDTRTYMRPFAISNSSARQHVIIQMKSDLHIPKFHGA